MHLKEEYAFENPLKHLVFFMMILKLKRKKENIKSRKKAVTSACEGHCSLVAYTASK